MKERLDPIWIYKGGRWSVQFTALPVPDYRDDNTALRTAALEAAADGGKVAILARGVHPAGDRWLVYDGGRLVYIGRGCPMGGKAWPLVLASLAGLAAAQPASTSTYRWASEVLNLARRAGGRLFLDDGRIVARARRRVYDIAPANPDWAHACAQLTACHQF